MIYKIWIQVEEIDEDKDHYEDIYTSASVYTTESKSDAINSANMLERIADVFLGHQMRQAKAAAAKPAPEKKGKTVYEKNADLYEEPTIV